MVYRVMRGASTALLVLLLSACSWLRPAPDPATVRLITADRLQGCTRVGTTHVSVEDRLQTLLQNEGQLAEELVSLARNSAVQFRGNAILAITGIHDGTQSFAIFQCRDDAGS